MPKAESGMGGIIKLAILAGGAYWIYDKYFVSSAAGSSPVVVGSGTPMPTAPGITVPLSVTNTTGPVSPAQVQNVTDLMGAFLAGDPGFLNGRPGATFDEWNWARSSFQAAPQSIEQVFPGMDRAHLLSLDEYVAGLRAKGIAGGRGMGDLGMILDLGDFFRMTPHRKILQGNFR